MGEFFPCTAKVTLRVPIPDPENYKKRKRIFNDVTVHAGNMLQMFRMEIPGKRGIHLIHIPVWNLCAIDVDTQHNQKGGIIDHAISISQKNNV